MFAIVKDLVKRIEDARNGYGNNLNTMDIILDILMIFLMILLIVYIVLNIYVLVNGYYNETATTLNPHVFKNYLRFF